jgi:catechol 2,3-dioxygenase-like lactoylglutathione lyase family enzyme
MLFVNDFAEMFAFYRDGLGPLGLNHGTEATDGWLPPGGEPYVVDENWSLFLFGTDLATSPLVLELFDAAVFAGTHPVAPNGVIVGCEVQGLEAAIDHLQAHGALVPDGIIQEPWGRIGHFHDPEGNRFELFEIDEH